MASNEDRGNSLKKDISSSSGFDDLMLEQPAFEALEKDFQKVLGELVGDKSLERFRLEYEKLHRALKKSHESEKRLVKRCRELNTEIVSNAAKVQTALKLSQEDQKTIGSLRREIEKAWKMVDASHEKESQANLTIGKLKTEINNLNKLVEQGAGLSIGQEHSVKVLLQMKEDLTRERDAQAVAITNLKGDITGLNERINLLDEQKNSLSKDMAVLQEELKAKHDAVEKELRNKEKTRKELEDINHQMSVRQADIKNKQLLINQGNEKLQRLELQLKEQKSLTEKAQKDYESLNQRTQKLQADLEDQINNNTQLLAENSQRVVDLRVKEEEIASLSVKEANSTKMKDSLLKKVEAMKLKQEDIEDSKEILKGEISRLEREIESYRRQMEGDKKQFEELMRERELLNKNLVKTSNAEKHQSDLTKIAESTKKNLDQEIQGYKIQAQNQRKNVYELEKQREKYINEANEASRKYLQAMEEVKLREMNIFELQKKIVEGESKLKQQQNLYEAVRSDRNLYSKNLIEAQDEIAEMKRKFRIMTQQIEQLKEEIGNKDKALLKDHFEHLKVEKERDSFKVELGRLEVQIELADQTIGSQQAEMQKLNHIINEADAERLQQKKEFDRVKNERDILGTQLIRRNDELSLLYEKIKIQQSTLSKGEAQYNERLEDIRILKIKIQELKRELTLLRNKVLKVDTLKQEVYQLERQLLQERTKVKALSEELENPMNIHRWRKLEGSDPNAFEMIQKIQTLQKRLIGKTEEVVEKDIEIQDLEQNIEDMQTTLSRMPTPETVKKLSVYKNNIKEKTKTLMTMTAQMNMLELQAKDYKSEVQTLASQLQDMQKRYFELKRREQEKEKMRTSTGGSLNGSLYLEDFSAPSTANSGSGTKFIGGGFNVSAKSVSTPK